MQLLGPLFRPCSKKEKKSAPKKILTFQEMEISGRKKLNKTLLEKTGCLRNFYYLLAAQTSSFLVHHSFPNTVSQATLCNLNLTVQPCIIYETPRHAIGHQVLPMQLFLGKQRISLGVASIVRRCLCQHSQLTCNQFNQQFWINTYMHQNQEYFTCREDICKLPV